MQSCGNAAMNRAAARNTSPYEECVRPLQFSSITAPGNPELNLWPSSSDPQWLTAQALASSAVTGELADITDGSTLYYAPGGIKSAKTITISGKVYPFPEDWNEAAVEFTVAINGQFFFRDI